MEPLNELEKEQRWPIKPEYREAMVKRLVRIIADPGSSTKEVTDASRALLAAERQNQSDETEILDDFNAQLYRLANDAGIDVAAITDQSAASDDPAGTAES